MYMFMPVRNFVNMYIHVCTMYRDVCTGLPILVQVVRIPDAESESGRSARSHSESESTSNSESAESALHRCSRIVTSSAMYDHKDSPECLMK